jgi:hypothetical protein
MLEIIKEFPNLLPAILAALVTVIGIVSSTLLALHRIKKIEIAREEARERYTFLGLTIDLDIIDRSENLVLVSIIIKLENKGKTRIEARRLEHLRNKDATFLYGEVEDDKWDPCMYAGTLKIREVSNDLKADLFDWYSLKPITHKKCLKDGLLYECDFEQINYLDEYEEAPDFKEVVFWIEPNESYKQQVMVYLPKGIYVLKAIFLGKITEPIEEEEYWSYTKLVKIM